VEDGLGQGDPIDGFGRELVRVDDAEVGARAADRPEQVRPNRAVVGGDHADRADAVDVPSVEMAEPRHPICRGVGPDHDWGTGVTTSGRSTTPRASKYGGKHGMAKLSAILDQIDAGTMLYPSSSAGTCGTVIRSAA
jgi:hypothetical protein